MPSLRGLLHSKRASSAAVLLLYACTAFFFLSLWTTRHTSLAGWAEKYCYSSLELPFAYRALVPATIRTAVAPIDEQTRYDWAEAQVASRPWLEKLSSLHRFEADFLPEFIVLMLIQYGSILGFALILRRQFAALYEDEGAVAIFAPVLALLMAIPVYWNAAYVYDLPQLLLFSAALYALSRQRWRSFYPLAALAFLNKETSILLLLASAVYLGRRMDRKLLARHLLAQASMFVLIRLFLMLAITPGPTTGFEGQAIPNHLVHNLAGLWSSGLFHDFGPQVTLLVLIGVTLRHLRNGPFFLRRTSLLFVPLLAAYLWGGMWQEIRVLGELFMVAFLLFYGGALETLGRPLTVRKEQQGGAAVLEDHPSARQLLGLGGMLLLALFFIAAAVTALSVALQRS